MAETQVTLQTGESEEVLFEAIAHVARTYQVVVDGLKGSFTAVAPPGLVLGYKNPKQSSTHWRVLIFDVAKKSWSGDYTPEPIGALKAFPELDPGKFLLIFKESYNVFFNDYEYGPFVLSIPAPGVYIWDAIGQRLQGLPAPTRLADHATSSVIGVIKAMPWVGTDRSPSGRAVRFLIEDASPERSVAWFFKGTEIYIEDAHVPYYGNYSPLIGVGQRVMARINMKKRTGLRDDFSIDSFKYPLEYPASAYSFIGSLSPSSFSVSGNVSSFAVVVAMAISGPEGTLGKIVKRVTGPVYSYPLRLSGFTFELWAHPNPDKYFRESDLYADINRLNNWQMLKSLTIYD